MNFHILVNFFVLACSRYILSIVCNPCCSSWTCYSSSILFTSTKKHHNISTNDSQNFRICSIMESSKFNDRFRKSCYERFINYFSKCIINKTLFPPTSKFTSTITAVERGHALSLVLFLKIERIAHSNLEKEYITYFHHSSSKHYKINLGSGHTLLIGWFR